MPTRNLRTRLSKSVRLTSCDKRPLKVKWRSKKSFSPEECSRLRVRTAKFVHQKHAEIIHRSEMTELTRKLDEALLVNINQHGQVEENQPAPKINVRVADLMAILCMTETAPPEIVCAQYARRLDIMRGNATLENADEIPDRDHVAAPLNITGDLQDFLRKNVNLRLQWNIEENVREKAR